MDSKYPSLPKSISMGKGLARSSAKPVPAHPVPLRRSQTMGGLTTASSLLQRRSSAARPAVNMGLSIATRNRKKRPSRRAPVAAPSPVNMPSPLSSTTPDFFGRKPSSARMRISIDSPLSGSAGQGLTRRKHNQPYTPSEISRHSQLAADASPTYVSASAIQRITIQPKSPTPEYPDSSKVPPSPLSAVEDDTPFIQRSDLLLRRQRKNSVNSPRVRKISVNTGVSGHIHSINSGTPRTPATPLTGGSIGRRKENRLNSLDLDLESPAFSSVQHIGSRAVAHPAAHSLRGTDAVVRRIRRGLRRPLEPGSPLSPSQRRRRGSISIDPGADDFNYESRNNGLALSVPQRDVLSPQLQRPSLSQARSWGVDDLDTPISLSTKSPRL